MGCLKFEITPADDDESELDAQPDPAHESVPMPMPIARPAPKLVTTPIEESSELITRSEPVALCDIDETLYKFCPSGLEPLDRVLGGGLVMGAVVLIGGEPGAGKSTLCMQWLDGLGLDCLYASGEENDSQIGARARRINVDSPRVKLVTETDVDVILDHARRMKVDILLIDSIQTLSCDDATGLAGSVTQVRECTHRLIKFAKKKGEERAVILVCQVNNDGGMAGPKTLKHLVDILLEFETGEGAERILHCRNKNRYGASGKMGRFIITKTGLESAPFEATSDDDNGGTSGGLPPGGFH